MLSITRNGRNYTRLYAWYPVQADSGSWIWLGHYYIRPGAQGVGLVLSQLDFQLEISRGC